MDNQIEVGVLIPAFEPDGKLIKLLTDLVPTIFSGRILVVDDGTEDQTIFDEINHSFSDTVKVIHHNVNQGKGAALKTGFAYFQAHMPTISGIATLDSDGQHTLKDLMRCISCFKQNTNAMVLGYRHFSRNIPFRSRFGNLLTDELVHLLTGMTIHDTQTGLRVIPMAYAQKSRQFKGNRFEFEFTMLLQAKDNGVIINEQPIETIYLDGNASSHFHVIKDSIAIYSRFIKFALSGLVSFGVDNGIFILLMQIFAIATKSGVMMATIIARLLSAIVNYQLNHRVVFDGKGEATIIKYIGIMIVQMILSAGLTTLATVMVGYSALALTATKIGIDFVLFFVSYQVQRRFIFVEAKHGNV